MLPPKYKLKYILVFALLFLCASAAGAFAQDVTGAEGAAGENPVVEQKITPDDISSLIYSDWEYTSLREAIAARALIDPDGLREEVPEEPVDTTPEEDKITLPIEDVVPILKGIRVLKLNGIVYVSQDDWTIWFNEQRITPTSTLPIEVTSLHVEKDYVEMTWLDNYTNHIFPIRLRPHQRFDLDTRMFLPGQN